jgi:hypothetical protein
MILGGRFVGDFGLEFVERWTFGREVLQSPLHRPNARPMFCRQPLHGAHGFTVCCTLVDVETVLPASAAREKDYVMPIFLICLAIEIVANYEAMVYPSPNSVIARCSAPRPAFDGSAAMACCRWSSACRWTHCASAASKLSAAESRLQMPEITVSGAAARRKKALLRSRVREQLLTRP